MSGKVLSGYHAVGLPLPHSSFQRYIYVKEHAVKKQEASISSKTESILAAGRTAYLVNLPPYASDQWLRAGLESLGAIQHIVTGSTGLSNEERGDDSTDLSNKVNRTAHVVFKTKEAMDQLLRMDVLEMPTPSNASGLQAYVSKYRHNRPGLVAIKEMADRYMASFDQLETEDLRRREELKNQVDDDGFQAVVNTKKRGVTETKEVLARPAKKQKAKELDNFYRFQTRERKRDQLKTLRERFEEDVLLVKKMKKANKFTPE